MTMEDYKKVVKEKMRNRFLGHGLPNIFGTQVLAKKVLWALAWLLGAALTIYLISESIRDYFKYEVSIKSRIVNENPLLFPKVTICNMDPFTTNKSVQFLANSIKNNKNNSLMANKFSTDLELVNYFIEHQQEYNFKANSLFLANNSDSETQQSLGYNISTFIYKCRFGVWKCNLSIDFEWSYNFKLGNCFTFNSGKQTDKFQVHQPGKKNGLQLELFVGKSDAFSSFYNNVGAKVFIYNHSSLYTESDSLDVSVGKETNIGLTKKIIRKLKQPYSDCEVDSRTSVDFDYSTFYTIFNKSNLIYRQVDCLDLCYQMLLVKNCGCIDYGVNFFNLFKINAPRVCVRTDYICMEQIFRNKKSGYYSVCNRQCPKECNDVTYAYTNSFSDYPSRTCAKKLLRDSSISVDFDLAKEDLHDKVLKLNIHFNDLKYQSIVESPEVNTLTLLANIGGTLGLFLGFSVLSIFEILEMLVTLTLVTLNFAQKALYAKIKQTFESV